MARATIAIIPRDGSGAKVYQGDLNGIELNLPDNVAYEMSLDQSSKETGIYMIDENESFHVIGNIARRYQYYADYMSDIKYFIQRNIYMRRIKLFIREEPPPKSDRAGKVLQQFIGFIETWRSGRDGIPELSYMPQYSWDNIMPSSWKSAVVDKKKGKGRFNVKREIAKDLCDRFPELWEYYQYVPPSSDYDGFDACGILHGYKLTRFKDNGVSTTASTKDYDGDIFTYFRLMTREQLTNQDELTKFVENIHERYTLHFHDMTPGHSFYSNVKMSASRTEASVTIVTDPLMKTMIDLQFGFDSRNHHLVVFILRKKIVGAKLQEALKKMYPYEVITW